MRATFIQTHSNWFCKVIVNLYQPKISTNYKNKPSEGLFALAFYIDPMCSTYYQLSRKSTEKDQCIRPVYSDHR